VPHLVTNAVGGELLDAMVVGVGDDFGATATPLGEEPAVVAAAGAPRENNGWNF
jgi:hypothetical protein